MEPLKLQFAWSRNNLILNEDQIFTDQRHFNGLPLTVTVMPWSHHVLGYEIPKEREDWHEENLYEGHYGYEMEMLEESRNDIKLTIGLTQGGAISQKNSRYYVTPQISLD